MTPKPQPTNGCSDFGIGAGIPSPPDFNERENAVLRDWLQDNVSAREA